MQRWHMVHIQTQSDFKISSSSPNAAIRKNFLGSSPERPVAGHPDEQAPQVKHRFRFPPSGRISMTLCINVLFCFPPSLMRSSDMTPSLAKFAISSFTTVNNLLSQKSLTGS
jgi:hypothetical protein